MKNTILIIVLMLTACAVGPDFHKPAAPQTSGYTKGPASNSGLGVDIPGEWWKLFKSSELNSLIKQSLKANPNLQAAEAGLHIAQENVKAQQGLFYPSVTANAAATRQDIAKSTPGSSPLASGQLLFSLYNAQVGVSYTPDVFGMNTRMVESLQAQAEMQRFQYLATYLTLTSNVVTAAIEEASLREQIEAAHRIIAIQTEMLDIVKGQARLGYSAGLEVAAQESQLMQAQASLPLLETQLATERDMLTALAGHLPADETTQKFTLSRLTLPANLPLSLPSKLVEHRPDIRAAEEQLHSASADIGVAVANRLPQFTIDAEGGYTGSRMAHLFNPADHFWSLTGGLAQPIFDGGNLLHKERAAEAAYQQAEAQYRSTVITAFQNVADTLHTLVSDRLSMDIAIRAEQSAKKTFDITSGQYRVGYVNKMTLLGTEQTYQQAKISRIQAQANLFTDSAALFQALGGGWWNR